MLATAAELSRVPASVPGTDPTNGVLGVLDRMRIGARFEQMNAIAAGGALRGPAPGTPAAVLATTTAHSRPWTPATEAVSPRSTPALISRQNLRRTSYARA
ncbi:hypothetical protein [Lapillicoccus sp.]|uniref:hypothetical protein n=1 Tax=Lapillicoccus sp. TaxID=1909287 RepID=UPI003982F231